MTVTAAAITAANEPAAVARGTSKSIRSTRSGRSRAIQADLRGIVNVSPATAAAAHTVTGSRRSRTARTKPTLPAYQDLLIICRTIGTELIRRISFLSN
ncbi:hypothetical protein [Nocardia sp. BMG111209]|uniref:hypothetical protein n=1 Tax=Nocardia sp. BMG111209 TaxID=1160137 RepID=UPI0003AAA72D|nr:hypothetical protein [Nocardia sp. BMG111209]